MYKQIPGNSEKCHKLCPTCGGTKYQDDFPPPIPFTEYCSECKGIGYIEINIKEELDRIIAHMNAINKQFYELQTQTFILRGFK